MNSRIHSVRPILSAMIACAALIAGAASGASAAIQANLEWPSANFPASGVGNVAEWAYTTTPGATIDRLIEVQIDPEPPFRVPRPVRKLGPRCFPW